MDLWPLWDNIRQPVLILRGADSTLFLQETADEMMKRGPGKLGLARLEVIPACGHVPSLMTKEQIDLLRGWLAMAK
jgi:pimeloyl-ACP methyl ester carboxylesterase